MIVMTYHKSDFHYDLPDERIARYPLPERSTARMLVARVLDADTVELGDRQVRDLPDYLDPYSFLTTPASSPPVSTATKPAAAKSKSSSSA